jgi:hypothetical protein
LEYTAIKSFFLDDLASINVVHKQRLEL